MAPKITSTSAAVAASGFLESEIAYARALRALVAGSERLHYFGFDLDMFPGSGIEDARARLAGVPEAEQLALALEDAWSAEQPVEDLFALLDELDGPDSALAGALPPERRRELVLDLHGLAESLRFRAKPDGTRGDVAGLLEAYARRERAMFRLFDAYVERVPAGEGVVLTGHNMHLGRSWEGVRWIEIGSIVPVPLWPTIGAHVSERFGDEVFAVWMIYDHGRHLTAGGSRESRSVGSVTGTVESLLARLPHDALLLPLASDDPRAAWLDEERTYRVNGGVGWGRLRTLTDALFFVREVTPPRVER